MAHTVPPPPAAALTSIARQIGERRAPANALAAAPGAPLQIAESFPVWMLGLDALQGPPGRLRTLAKETGTWHHQITQGNQAKEFARSVPGTAPTGADWRLVELGNSPTAGRIGETIDWIDQYAPANPLVQFLFIPAYYLIAFWLEQSDKDQIVVVDKPARFENIHYLEIYDYERFRSLLLEVPRPQGVPPPG